MLPEDYPSARWRDFRLGERHCDGSFHPSPSRSDAHLRGRAQCDDVLRHLHFDAMQSDARIGHGGAMHLEGRLQTGWECENRGCLPFFRRVPVATDSDCVECDDQQLAYQRGTIIHFPIRIRLDEGYGKLCSSNPHIHVAELFGEEPELLTRTVVPSVDPDVRAVFACLRVLDVEHESVFVCDCPIGFHPRAGKPYRLRRLTADQEYRRANRVDLVYGMLELRYRVAE